MKIVVVGVKIGVQMQKLQEVKVNILLSLECHVHDKVDRCSLAARGVWFDRESSSLSETY
jgi:hypothetical protein